MEFGVNNLWEQLVFETNDPQQYWDGTKNGKESICKGIYFSAFCKIIERNYCKKI